MQAALLKVTASKINNNPPCTAGSNLMQPDSLEQILEHYEHLWNVVEYVIRKCAHVTIAFRKKTSDFPSNNHAQNEATEEMATTDISAVLDFELLEIVDKPERPERHLERSHTVTELTSAPSLLFSVLASDFPHAGHTSGPKYWETWYIIEPSWNWKKSKKVLLRERKRHTARRVVNTPSVVLSGHPPPLTWLGGYPVGGYPIWVPPLPGYPPRAGPGRVPPPGCPMAFWEMLQSIMGYGYPPGCPMAFWEMLQSIMGYGYPPPPPPGVDRHYLPHPSDAGGNNVTTMLKYCM